MEASIGPMAPMAGGCRNGLFYPAIASVAFLALGGKGQPLRLARCWLRRSSWLSRAARTCRIASPLGPSFQNFSLPPKAKRPR